MLLYQTVYCKRVLERFGMDMAKSASTLMAYNIDSLFKEEVLDEAGQDDGGGFPTES